MSVFSLSVPAPAEPSSRKPKSSRAVHIDRLNDVLHLSLQRGDLTRARNAWAILVRCKEYDWKANWRTGLAVAGDPGPDGESRRIDYLRATMLRCSNEREAILRDLVMSLISQGRYRVALDELEFYLPNFPFLDNPTIHLYAGMLCLYMSQMSTNSSSTASYNPLLRDAQAHFEKTLALDPRNEIASEYKRMVRDLEQARQEPQFGGKEDSDDD